MTTAVCDSGPLTHLYQIDQWIAFRTFSEMHTTDLVVREVENHVPLGDFPRITSVALNQHTVTPKQLADSKDDADDLQQADRSILLLAMDRPHDLVLTDDLALRRAVERYKLTPMGSVGILVRGFKHDLLDAASLDQAIERLFDDSTLYLSPAFREHVRRMIHDVTHSPGNDDEDSHTR